MLKLIPYICKNIMRNKMRTCLTILGVLIGVGIFSFLVSVEHTMEDTIAMVSKDTILITQQKDQW